MPALKVIVCYLHWGPYHLARARALLQVDGIQPYFLEVARYQTDHLWLRDPERGVAIETLWSGALQDIPAAKVVRRLKEVLERISPDVVVTCGYGDPVMRAAAAWARKSSRGSLLWHETTRKDRRRWALKEFAKGILVRRLYHAALVSGKAHREYLVELGMDPEWIMELDPAVDNAFFQTETEAVRRDFRKWRERLELPDRYFLYVGRLAADKNVESLLRAYELYRERTNGECGLVLVGDGPEKPRLLTLAQRPALRDVVFAGYRPTSDLPPYYAMAEWFVLPSVIEPWGLVVNEAMAGGLPLLLSRNCGCAPDLLSEEVNGFSFAPRDIEALAELLCKVSALSATERARMGAASKAIISAYTPERWAQGLVRGARLAMTRAGKLG
ncbi:glycosyltransferase family 4 protein [Methylacidimicrobium tartarophylax]|uniref:Alpha-D-kanosaminyltransferase n=1 Tax=Methylacidimicrobium tartarophylax TaxID=1041768 RepID=A0A5E6MM43_9BACT|nr:glycosyltransferase family 4 protein [Methylacidimicrobium tartarophylax]VVM06494.1 Alpha-D-kanosaminyltransferase [Methylacidimicrobium tartarophylax]